MPKHRKLKRYERYALSNSPFANNPTQKDVATLVRETKAELKKLATPNFKNQFIVRRTIETGGKTRDLVYPEGRLRAVHERLKFHFNKIIQPSYLMSPRKNRSQRDNAATHLDARQYLTLDIKQFYPSTSRGMIRNSLIEQFDMSVDVAGLIAHLATADDKACFGSPLTPVLASLVHRPMFDAISDLCEQFDLEHTVWVDDLTISGEVVNGEFIANIRQIIARYGLKSHKLVYRTGNRAVFITGIGVVGKSLVVPRYVELKSKKLWNDFQNANSLDQVELASTRLLSHLGGIRHVVGNSSKRGQKISNEMNSIRQKRNKAIRLNAESSETQNEPARQLTSEEKIERSEEIAAIPF